MKKIVLSALVAAFSLCANAQYESKAGDIALEVGFNPFSNSFNTIKLNGGSINARYFINDNTAARVNLGFGYEGTSDNLYSTNPNGDEVKTECSKHAGSFSLDLGIENHFANAGRLDLYAGGQLGIATTFGGGKFGNTEVSGAAISSGWSTGSIDPCATTFSLKAFTGANFFVYKKLYVGAEFGVSFSNKSYKDYEVTIDSRTTKKKNDLSKTSFDFFAEPALHLGWVF